MIIIRFISWNLNSNIFCNISEQSSPEWGPNPFYRAICRYLNYPIDLLLSETSEQGVLSQIKKSLNIVSIPQKKQLSVYTIDCVQCTRAHLQAQYSIQYSWAIIFRRLFSKRCTFGSKSGTKSLVRRYQSKFAKNVQGPKFKKSFKCLAGT